MRHLHPSFKVPLQWSEMAKQIASTRYFQGDASIEAMILRVADTITKWGQKGGYFSTHREQKNFHEELVQLLVTQKMAFNSPVWFNVGVQEHPQCSACFINSVEDSMESILGLAKTEGLLFKQGSGTGTNFSTLRSSGERISSGGFASGPVSFMRGYDSFAGAIRSGGRARRAAKMAILNIDHPDILEFIDSKAKEEKKAAALIMAGFDPRFSVPGGAYSSVQFQNGNHSVRVTDDFMHAVENDGTFETKSVKEGQAIAKLRARDVWRRIAESAWACGDPGVQFDTTINRYNPCKKSGRINASNPCSEYMFLDDSACNLASLNLMRFRTEQGEFDIEAFCHAIEITLLAQNILIDFASYPTPKIKKNSLKFRPIGLGYTNLGAFIMSEGLPYDSAQARALAASITALMTGHAYEVSAQLSKSMGPFSGYKKNRKDFLEVIAMHRASVEDLDRSPIADAARLAWGKAEKLGQKSGYRNAQVTVIAPTGTIGLMMDCDTMGIEPDIALVKIKKLANGESLRMVNKTVPMALTKLGYSEQERVDILSYLDQKESLKGAPHLKPEHVTVFDDARQISPRAHILMMAAVQPFLSGAISKTVNMRHEVTAQEIERLNMDAWKLGLKSIAVYRDGCKQSQPL